jgi:hypothetical protein
MRKRYTSGWCRFNPDTGRYDFMSYIMQSVLECYLANGWIPCIQVEYFSRVESWPYHEFIRSELEVNGKIVSK